MRTPESQEKALQARLDTFGRQREWRRRRILELREKGAVPAAIADEVEVSLEYVHDVLREHEIALPPYFDLTEYGTDVPQL
jgi:hypothetical protein